MTIQNNVNITTEVKAYSVTVEGGVTVTIKPTGGLTVGAGGISGVSETNLKLEASQEGATKGQTGFLRISPDYVGEMPEATIELFSKGYYNKEAAVANSATWQCVGSPIADEGVSAKTIYKKSWIYSWNEKEDEWQNHRSTLELEPFTGYLTTQYQYSAGTLLTYKGDILPVNAGVKTINLAKEGNGRNFLANSYTAPIDITKFEEGDFVNADMTIYILNTGSKQNESDAAELGNDAPGKFFSVPVGNAEELEEGDPLLIAPMQGFCVLASKADAQVRLNYSRLVWGVNYTGDRAPKPLRVAKQNTSSPVTGKVKISLKTDESGDCLYLLESENFRPEFENGYDAHKMSNVMSDMLEVFAIEGEDTLSVDATNSIVGTHIGVRTNDETAYTFVFSNLRGEQDLALLDMETGDETDIEEGNDYTFFIDGNQTNSVISERFMIIERSNAPAITTGNDGVSAEVKAQKFIKNNCLYIYKDGVLYNALGERVR